MPLKHLYIGEFGYGNLGDDVPVQLMKKVMGDTLETRSFSHLGSLGGIELKTLIVGGGTLLDCRGSGWMRTLLELSTEFERTVLAGTGLDPGEPWTHQGIVILATLLQGIKPRDRLVRGPISKAMIKVATGLDCEIGLDPMVLYEPTMSKRGERILIVPGHQAKTVASVLYHERMINVAKQLSAVKWQVGFLPVWRRDIDLAVLYSHEVGNDSLVVNGTSFEHVVEAMTDAHVVITDRLHAGLLALILGRPALFMAHHMKAIDLCLALGWPHYLAPSGDDWPFVVSNFAEHAPSIPMPKLEEYRGNFQRFIRSLQDG